MRARGTRRVGLAIAAGLMLTAMFGGVATAEATDASAYWFHATGPVPPGVAQSGAIDTDGDVDWYYFYTSASGQVKVGINGRNGSSELSLCRWDGGRLVEVADCTSGGSGLIDKQLPAGLYYVKVNEWSGHGSYDFTVSGTYAVTTCPAGVQAHPTPVEIAEDSQEGWWNATGALTPTRPYVAAIDTDGDVDWYYFYTSASGQVKVGINGRNGSSELSLYRWDGGRLVEVADCTSGGSGLIDKLLPAGLYYVKANEWSGHGDYDFTVSGTYALTTCPAGVQAHPTPVLVTEDYSEGYSNAQGPMWPTRPYVAAIDTDGDVDWYYFYTSASGQVKVGINGRNGSSELSLYRWDGARLVEVADCTSGGGGLIDKQLPGGQYYIKVNEWSGNADYDFTVSGSYVVTKAPSTVGTPVAPKAMRRGASATVYASLKPRHAAGSSPVLIYMYRYVSGHWKAYGSVSAKAADYLTYTRCSAQVKFATKGAWRLRAFAPADSAHLAVWSSGYRYVTVK